MTDYKYDIFLSYKRGPTSGAWVHTYFAPTLINWLEANCPGMNVFFDESNIENGSDIPDNVAAAIKSARVLLSVWSADYFRSHYCMTEWRSFIQREKDFRDEVGLPCSLVYPVKFCDGDEYHPEAKAKKCKWDFSIQLNSPSPVFAQSTRFLEFEDKVKGIVGEIEGFSRNGVPEWCSAFPIVKGDPLPRVRKKRTIL